MLISYSHRFIFFHVAKVAGLSIRAALRDYTQEPEKFKIRRPPKLLGEQPNPLYQMWQTQLLHATSKDARDHLPTEVYANFLKFAFVRNPWDWQVSMYNFIINEHDHIHHDRVKAMTGFEDYLEWVIHAGKPFARGATKFQKDMVTDAQGQLLVDFVGRYETLAQDFKQVCRMLKLKAALPHENRTTHADYRTYYNGRTRDLVAEHFRADIELFGYTFASYTQPEYKGFRSRGNVIQNLGSNLP